MKFKSKWLVLVSALCVYGYSYADPISPSQKYDYNNRVIVLKCLDSLDNNFNVSARSLGNSAGSNEEVFRVFGKIEKNEQISPSEKNTLINSTKWFFDGYLELYYNRMKGEAECFKLLNGGE
ncbi:hypothetical protein [Burkholderia multivorans]|uniref:hypothetical protein n=1 Tax=Burkholderia multivorans TaxID=87883 RepID=UPI0021BEB169|nr:hypothetical protein [Burkholderia multivorans]